MGYRIEISPASEFVHRADGQNHQVSLLLFDEGRQSTFGVVYGATRDVARVRAALLAKLSNESFNRGGLLDPEQKED